MNGLQYFEIVRALSFEKYFDGQILDKDSLENGADLLRRVIGLLWELEWNGVIVLSSGYRNSKDNAAVGGAPHSYHRQAKALDLYDPELKLANEIKSNPLLLLHYGLWLEEPESTKDHAHLDTGNRVKRPVRVFKP